MNDSSPEQLAPTRAEVDLGALRHNARLLQSRAGEAALMAVVKADAYGHGAVRVARTLREEGVRHFAVATVPEALVLRRAGLEDRILVFGAPLPAVLPACAAHDLDVTVSSPAVADAVADAARRHGPLRAHVKVDTGMGRIGVAPEDAAGVVRRLEQAPGVTLAGLWTHFATADEEDDAFMRAQLDRFERAVAPLRDAAEYVHAGNSGALLQMPGPVTEPEHVGPRALVRVGITLYGLSPAPDRDLAAAAGLRPILRFVSHVTQIKTVAPGTSVSYGRRWFAERPTRVATVGAGYADGYVRLLTNRAEVGIGGGRYAVAGTVCMDMFMVDLGGPGGSGDAVEVGDEVVLLGEGGPSALEVARWAETIPYELTCGITARVPRVYAAA